MKSHTSLLKLHQPLCFSSLQPRIPDWGSVEDEQTIPCGIAFPESLRKPSCGEQIEGDVWKGEAQLGATSTRCCSLPHTGWANPHLPEPRKKGNSPWLFHGSPRATAQRPQ